MHDIVIANGRVAAPDGIAVKDIAIDGGRIAGLGDRGALRGRRVIDAEGRLVIPGVVDSHVHVRDPGFTHKEDFASCSAGAAASGVTTIMCMPNTNPMLDSAAGFRAMDEAARGRCVVDYALQALASPHAIGAIPELKRLGVVSFELFLGGGRGPLFTDKRADQLALFEALAGVDALAGVYPEDLETVEALEPRASGDVAGIALAHPGAVEAGGLLNAVALAATAGCRVHFRQMSTEISALAAQWARRVAMPGRFTAEVTPHHLALTEADWRRHGPEGTIAPPLRPAGDIDALWQALRQGGVDAIGTDHAPHAAEEKARGREDLRKAPGGFSGVETFLPSMLTEFRRRGLRVEDFVRLCCANPARLFGLYPRKGAIAAGSDADIAIVDDETRWHIDPARFHSKAKYSPFAGREMTARAVTTLVRGAVVYENGALTAPAGHGRLLTPA